MIKSKSRAKAVTAFVCLYPITVVACLTFNLNLYLSLALGSFFSLLLTISISALGNKRSRNKLDEQLLWLLEYLSAALTSGITLENSLVKAANELQGSTNTNHHKLSQALGSLKNCLLSQLDFQESMRIFLDNFNSNSAYEILGKLQVLRDSGARIDIYIQDSCNMLRERIELTRSIESEHNGKLTESFIMTTAPFIMALILNNSGDFSYDLMTRDWGEISLTLICCISVLSLVILFVIVSRDDFKSAQINDSKWIRFLFLGAYWKNNDVIISNSNLSFQKIKQLIYSAYKNVLPSRLLAQAKIQLQYEARRINSQVNRAEDRYITAKIRLIALTIPLALIVVVREDFAAFVLSPVFAIILQDLYLAKKIRNRQNQENLKYPQWLNQLTVLLNSGLTLQKALSVSSRSKCSSNVINDSTRNHAPDNYFLLEMSAIRSSLAMGTTPTEIVYSLSARSSLYQVKHTLELMTRYEREGSREILNLITISSSSCWSIFKEEIRRRLQMRSLCYLLPSSISLIAVIATAMLPAIASMTLN
jgi:tight adherence protein C